jgi:diguanylate cyclase (GGDEF)-like protein
VLQVAGGSYAAVLLLGLAFRDPELGLVVAFAAPTALVTIAFGVRGAMIGTAVSLGLMAMPAIVLAPGLGPAAYVARGGVVALVAATVAVSRAVAGRHDERDASFERELQSRLELQATTDPLTGLPNRRRFEEEAERTLDHIARYGRRAAVLMLDLDGFKAVNDTVGHHAGDEVLTSVSARLVARLRSSDLIARLGGDEFVVLLPEVGMPELGALAEQLLEQIQLCTRVWRGVLLPVAGSIGIALFESSSGERLAELVRRADASMYEAKRAGGGQYRVDGALPAGSHAATS